MVLRTPSVQPVSFCCNYRSICVRRAVLDKNSALKLWKGRFRRVLLVHHDSGWAESMQCGDEDDIRKPWSFLLLFCTTIEKAITSKMTVILLVVHPFGRISIVYSTEAEMRQIQLVASNLKLDLQGDCAECFTGLYWDAILVANIPMCHSFVRSDSDCDSAGWRLWGIQQFVGRWIAVDYTCHCMRSWISENTSVGFWRALCYE